MSDKYLNLTGLQSFLNQLKAYFGRSVSATTTSTTVSIQLKNALGNDIGNAATFPAATTSAAGAFTADDKAKLNAIESGAEVNQNAFSNVLVGSTNIQADAEADTLELIGGNNVTLTPNATNDSVTIDATDTTYSDATTSDSGLMSSADKTKLDAMAVYGQKIFHATCDTAAATTGKVAVLDNATGYSLVAGVVVAVTFKYGNSATTPTLLVTNGSDTAKTIAIPKSATEQYTGGGTTYNSWGPYETLTFTYDGTYWVHSDSGRLMYAAYNKANSAAPKASPALTGTPTAPTPAAGTNTTQIATTAFVLSEIAGAISGTASFMGTVSANSTLENAAYAAGNYWVIDTAGTYAGQTCEVGDMIYAIADKGAAYSASDFSVVQTNIDTSLFILAADLVCITTAEIDALFA